jgi:hypothetical protein
LIENQSVSSFDGTIDSKVNYVYGIDFFIGDILQIENEYGITGRSRAIELIFSEDLSGSDTFPTFQMVE